METFQITRRQIAQSLGSLLAGFAILRPHHGRAAALQSAEVTSNPDEHAVGYR